MASDKVPFCYDAVNLPPRVDTGGPELPFDASKTRQSEARDADVNVIMARYEKTGVLPEPVREGLFLDVSAIGSYQDIREHINQAHEFFMQLPAVTRAAFGNSAEVFLDRAIDPAFKAQFVELGLLEKDEASPSAAPVAPSSSSAVASSTPVAPGGPGTP